MQIIRTILWILALFVVLVFSWGNWDQDVTVRIWENIVWETKLPAVVIVAFLLGLLPTWLYSRGVRWRLHRRIATLENEKRNREAVEERREAHPATVPTSSTAHPTARAPASQGEAHAAADDEADAERLREP